MEIVCFDLKSNPTEMFKASLRFTWEGKQMKLKMTKLFKLLEPTEIGKMFCLLGLAKALMKMIGKPLFSLLYKVVCFLCSKQLNGKHFTNKIIIYHPINHSINLY